MQSHLQVRPDCLWFIANSYFREKLKLELEAQSKEMLALKSGVSLPHRFFVTPMPRWRLLTYTIVQYDFIRYSRHNVRKICDGVCCLLIEAFVRNDVIYLCIVILQLDCERTGSEQVCIFPVCKCRWHSCSKSHTIHSRLKQLSCSRYLCPRLCVSRQWPVTFYLCKYCAFVKYFLAWTTYECMLEFGRYCHIIGRHMYEGWLILVETLVEGDRVSI